MARAFPAILLIIISHATPAAHYGWHIDPANPTTGVLRLALETPLKKDTIFITRQTGPAAAEVFPHCENLNKALQPSGQGWRAPAGCSAITWSVAFTTIESPNINLGEQANLYHPDGWWLLTEWGSLLRAESQVTNGTVCARLGDTSTCRSLPGLHQPPLFLLAGEPDHTRRFGDIAFHFFHALLPADFDPVVLHDSLAHQLTYLTSLIHGKERAVSIPSEIDVLILGIDESLDVVGGAAGHTAYLANVAIGDDGIASTELVRLLWITGHELIHLLGLDSAPLWAAESLAHYYGYKSMRASEEAQQLFERMLEDLPDLGLLQAHHRVTQKGEGQYYGLFYTRGAAFWRALDRQLTESTGGEYDLDVFLPMLREHDFGAEGELPPVFIDALRKRIEPSVLDQLFDRYL